MPFPIALRRALTALVGAVFAILCMGVGAIASPIAKSGAAAPVSAAQQQYVGTQARAADVQSAHADDAIPVVSHYAAGTPPTTAWTRPEFGSDTSIGVTRRHTSRSAPAEVGRAPPA